MSVNARWTAVGIAIALCAGLPPADATTWYVAPPPAGSDAHNGTDGWDQAFATITNAVTNAVDLDTIRLASGDYPIQSEIGVDKGVTIVGEGGRDNTFVFRTGSQSNRIFRINHSNAVLDGLTISNGLLSAAPGAGIYLLKGTVRNCLIARNAGDNGNLASGIGVTMAGGVLSNCNIVWNAWLSSSSGDIYGGGVQATAGTIQNCLIASNSANTAGGVFLYGTKALVEDCTIVSNYARAFIGGIFVKAGTIRNSVIRGNRGSCGGMQIGDWIFNNGYAYNCLVISNYGGAGAEIRGNESRIWNCTIVSNLNGGARFARAYEGQIYNSIVYDNTGGDFIGAAGTVTHSCASAFLYSDPSNTTNPPSFVNPAGGNYRLNVNSPCINAGMNQSWMTNAYDLEGGQRIRYRAVDMGAYERVYEGSVYNFY